MRSPDGASGVAAGVGDAIGLGVAAGVGVPTGLAVADGVGCWASTTLGDATLRRSTSKLAAIFMESEFFKFHNGGCKQKLAVHRRN
jgi:hypothetical protein